MQHDAAPATPARAAGIDRATDTGALCIIDAHGQITDQLTTPATAAGIGRLVDRLTHRGVELAAIKRPDSPVVDALLGAGPTVIVIPPRQVKHLRTRDGSAGNKHDRFDAFVLADTVRTDHPRLTPLHPDTPATTALRSSVRARTDLAQTRVGLCNQLRAHLRVVLPAAVGLFADLDWPVSLALLARLPSTDAAAWLTHRRLGAWLAATSDRGRTPTPIPLQRLTDAPAGLRGQAATAAHTTLADDATLRTLRDQITALDTHITKQLALHPDRAIWQSLPSAGTIRAANLLVEVGDARGHFPTQASLAALAGAAPSTRQSGRHQVVAFRWACDNKLRDAVTDVAADSRRASPWATAIYARHRAKGKTHQHAVRILARAWPRAIWRSWQDHTPYNPALHGIRRAQLLPVTT